jgi:hypothetical protein
MQRNNRWQSSQAKARVDSPKRGWNLRISSNAMGHGFTYLGILLRKILTSKPMGNICKPFEAAILDRYLPSTDTGVIGRIGEDNE